MRGSSESGDALMMTGHAFLLTTVVESSCLSDHSLPVSPKQSTHSPSTSTFSSVSKGESGVSSHIHL